MKTCSKPLYEFLLNANMLNGTPEKLAAAKKEYRRIYKREWKARSLKKKEIRLILTPKQFIDVKLQAHRYKLTHTAYARNILLASTEEKELIPNKDKLLMVLQHISIAAISASKNTLSSWQLAEYFERAESLLLEYLSLHT